MHSGLNGACLLRNPSLSRQAHRFSKPEPSPLTSNSTERISGWVVADLHIESVVLGEVVVVNEPEGHQCVDLERWRLERFD